MTFRIWSEWHTWAPGQYNPDDDNSDVRVIFDDGRRYAATFFTIKNVAKLLEQQPGSYFWASHAIVVTRLDDQTVRSTIEELLRSETFETVFERLSDADVDDSDDNES
jgi:hypothetical protein